MCPDSSRARAAPGAAFAGETALSGHSKWASIKHKKAATDAKKGQAFTLTAEALVKRLVALTPPARGHLTSLHGVHAPNAKLRPLVLTPRGRTPLPTPASSFLV